MAPDLKKFFFRIISNPVAFPLLAFFIPLVLRAIPEVLMGPYLVGFDTLAHYVPTTLRWLGEGVGFLNFVAVAPFLHVILVATTYTGVPIVVSLKIISPLLLGLLGLAVYFYARKVLSWSPRKSLLVVLFGTLYFVALRVSWDMLRSELALIFLFVTLLFLQKSNKPLRNGFLLSLAMLAVVFAHQLVALIMFFIVFLTLIRLGFDKQLGEIRRLVVFSIPATILFFVIVYANSVVYPEFSLVSGWLGQSSEGFMTLFGFGSYGAFVVDTLGFLVFCYLPLLPLVVMGFKRFAKNLQLKGWVLCIFIALSLAFTGVFIAHLPYRWILLLTYPLAFYAAEGFVGLKSNRHKMGFGLFLGVLSLCFILMPNNLALPYFGVFPLYVPTSMLQNTVSLNDCQDTVKVLQWAKTNMPTESRLLVHRAFYGWACLSFDSDQLISYDYNNPEVVAQKLSENGFDYQLYLVWWVNGSGWYGQPNVPSAFGEPLHESGRLAIFTYTSN